MPDATLNFTVRTPHDVVLKVAATSIRVLTETGHVGLRPRMEPTVLAVETGTVNVTTEEGMQFVATAGGLLYYDGGEATLLTPLAVAAAAADDIASALERMLTEPSVEMSTRAMLDNLEGKILSELRQERSLQDGHRKIEP